MKIYYRVSYNGVGIYEALKKAIWNSSLNPEVIWDDIKNSSAFTWLKKPDFYPENGYSYFTEVGYDLFIKNTYPIILKYIGKKDINIEKFIFNNDDLNIVYSDCHQIVILK